MGLKNEKQQQINQNEKKIKKKINYNNLGKILYDIIYYTLYYALSVISVSLFI